MKKILAMGLLGVLTTATLAFAAEDVSGTVAPGTTKKIYKTPRGGGHLEMTFTCDVATEVTDDDGVINFKSGIAYLMKPNGDIRPNTKCMIDVPGQPTNCTFDSVEGDTLVLQAYGQEDEDKTGCEYTNQ